MKRFDAFLFMAMMAFSVLWAADATFDFSTASGIAAMGYSVPGQSAATNLVQAGPVTVGGVTLTAADGATPTRIWNSQGNYTLRVYVDGSITLSVDTGSITRIVVSAANASNFDLIASVGNYSVSGLTGTWSGGAASVTLTHIGSKNAQIATLVVTTSSDSPGGDPGDDPIDPNITKLDSLNHLADLADGTEFQFTSDVYVNYRWRDYLWVMQLDDEGTALAGCIRGDTGKEYELGAVIPAGWTGRKNTSDNGCVDVRDPAHFRNAINMLDEYYYSAFDCTGYMSYVAERSEGWENYKVAFDRIRLSNGADADWFHVTGEETNADGNRVEVSMMAHNLFGIDMPAIDPTEVYHVEGMVMPCGDDGMMLIPIVVTPAPGTRLWKVLYEGEDGVQYKLIDTLYVAAVSNAGDGKLVYVTDNVDQIYYDTYEEWGYAAWVDWYPDWIALDCGDDEALFESLSGQFALMPGTVRGVLSGRALNPRLILNGDPAVLADAEYPGVTVFAYDLSEDYIGALGNELARADGRFVVRDGIPFLCSDDGLVAVKLNFDYAPALESEMAGREGCRYGLLCVFKLDEVWEENAPSLSRRRISATADDYFTNYTIYPLQVLTMSSLDELKAGRQAVNVRYISPAGVCSDEPHDGMNIEVTTFDDGSRSTLKRVKR